MTNMRRGLRALVPSINLCGQNRNHPAPARRGSTWMVPRAQRLARIARIARARRACHAHCWRRRCGPGVALAWRMRGRRFALVGRPRGTPAGVLSITRLGDSATPPHTNAPPRKLTDTQARRAQLIGASSAMANQYQSCQVQIGYPIRRFALPSPQL